MKIVLSDMFSPILSIHLYSFFILYLVIFLIVSLLSYSPYHFPHLTVFPYFFPCSHSFPFSFIFPFLFIYFPLSLSHFSISFLFPFFFSQISRNSFYFSYISFHFSIFHVIHCILSSLSLIYYGLPWVGGLVIFLKSMFYLRYPHNAL
jgi:hypothetical protein